MEKMEEKVSHQEDASQLNRNRSFKSKQLVRSQAIRESQSPPRTASPAVTDDNANAKVNVANVSADRTLAGDNVNPSSHVSDDRCSDVISYSVSDDDVKKQPVEIQITPGAWDIEPSTDQRQRTKRWLNLKQQSDSMRDLLSNNPRVACVCGNCAACPHCRGRRRKPMCPTKQDSGIVCSDECPDCEPETVDKAASLDAEHGYCRCPERKEKPKNITLSRTDSDDKAEPTGIELVNFIKETLNKNTRDRKTLLAIENELLSLVNDTGRCIVRFPVMTSYNRMLVHRCAALFQLSHHLDQTTKTAVLVSKNGTSGGRIPCTSFREWCAPVLPHSPQRHNQDLTHAKSILKRDTHSLDEPGSGTLAAARSKSLEQREKEYERVRRRIFSTEETQWPWQSGAPVKLLTSDGNRNKLLKVQSLESGGGAGEGRRGGRGAVAKSHSFGGYGGDTQPRLLSRQGDLASSSWRLSPSSSGYKTLSLRSTDSVTPSPTGGASPEPSSNEGVTVVWAVTDLSAVPAGALVIHPQTCRPLTNPDGSIYHFDPANPPVLYETPQQENAEKKRGKLEKQHSFIDNDCECPPAEEVRSKCCCQCRKHEDCHKNSTEKAPQQTEQKCNSIPSSPSKNRYDSETTNHKPTEPAVNHRNDPVTNHKQDSPNHRASFDSPKHRQYEATKQRSFDKPNFELPNHRFENEKPVENHKPDKQVEQTNQKHFESANQRPPSETSSNQRPTVNKPSNHGSPEVSYVQPYAQGFRNDEVSSPSQAMANQTFMPDMAIQNAMVQAKMTPVPMPDPNIRPVSLTNLVYPTAMAQGYPFVNQCRMEQTMQPTMYQPFMQQTEEQKLTPSPHNNENTFRIDPSYPYATVDYASQCGACTDPAVQHRSFNVPYGQVEVPCAVPPAYPVMLQPHPQPYPYQEAVQWAGVGPYMPVANAPKLVLQDCPVVPVPAPIYPHYNILYPQVISQPYQICQPVYPVIDKQEQRRNSLTGSHRQSKRNSISGSSRNTPATPPVDKNLNYDKDKNRPSSGEMAVKIQQMRQQMAQLGVREKREGYQRDFRQFPNKSADNVQLSSAAQAIVNSIRNMQAKNNYQDNRRPEYQNRDDRQDQAYRNRPRPERDDRRHRKQEREGRENSVPFQCRPPYLLRQMSPGTWCRRSPGPVHPVLNPPRRPHPDPRNGRR